MFNRRQFLAGCCTLPAVGLLSSDKVFSTETVQPFTKSINVCAAYSNRALPVGIFHHCYQWDDEHRSEKMEKVIKQVLRIDSPVTMTCTDVAWGFSRRHSIKTIMEKGLLEPYYWAVVAVRLNLQGDKKAVCNEYNKMRATKIKILYYDKQGNFCSREQAHSSRCSGGYEWCPDAKMSYLMKGGIHIDVQELMQDYHFLRSWSGRFIDPPFSRDGFYYAMPLCQRNQLNAQYRESLLKEKGIHLVFRG
ncbi:MAG: hypothetical protein LBJ67_06270 [Planctomycetaceae bacterium]|jgi:hypothetical protein|nr:hypothetical protein [Planctomycetaceae bacterium]